ncbi:MAG: DNA translocase FtsK [bacterium]|nr:DNA translocase FtsK [bacterium]
MAQPKQADSGFDEKALADNKAEKAKKEAANSGSASKTSSKQPSADKGKKAGNEPTRTPLQPRYEVKPEFWDALLDSFPPWLDEIGAIALLVFGIVSFMAIFNVSPDATLAIAWSNALRSLFGYGSLLVSGGIFALGIIILLPKIGITVSFPTRRVLALEIGFLAVLAIMHLSSGDSELRAIARNGEGGGYIGWGMSAPLHWAFGPAFSTLVYTLILILSFGVVIGITRTQVNHWLQTASDRLKNYSQRMFTAAAPPAPPAPPVAAEATAPPPMSLSPRRPPTSALIRIRPNFDALPPSMRPGAGEATEKSDINERFEKLIVTGGETNPAVSASLIADYDLIGKPVENKGGKGAPLFVERPDGRVKRYFALESMKEPKKLAKRDKALPPLELLQDVEMNPPDEYEINRNVVLIENTLMEFDINIDVVDVKVGPTVTQYAVQPFRENKAGEGENVMERTRLSKIAALSRDLELALSAKRLRLETPVPGHSYMGIEVPNKNPSTVALRSVYESRDFHDALLRAKSPLVIPLGRDVAGNAVSVDLASMPHLLIAGTTGSGKSVAIAAMAAALILNNTPDRVKMVMLDPKMVELSRFNGLPHLLGPVETDMERIIGVLRWCTREMDRRYKLLEENVARNIADYNARLGQRRKDEQLPYIVIMIDEIGDLMMSRPDETEKTVTRLAQMARAVGMHLVVATQRPSVDVITGLIKANFPSRIAFAVASGIDSRVILDTVGAESLLGRGDMLYLAVDAAAPRRLQGCYVTDSEVRDLVKYWKDWYATQITEGKMEKAGVAPWDRGLTRREFLSEIDPMLEDAIELVVNEQEASASLIQRKLGLGYPRAARMIDLLEELGVIGEPVAGGRSRKVMIEKGKDPFKELDKKGKK